MAVSAEYAVFAIDDFDSNDYANAVLAGEQYETARTSTAPKVVAPEPSAKEEISIAISKLTTGVDDVSKQIKTLVTNHHQDLLAQAANASDLTGSLTSVRSGLSDLEGSVEKLRLKVRVPYQSLQANVARLHKLQQASDILRRTSRFVTLTRRLQVQMADMEQSAGQEDAIASATPADGIADDDVKERAIAKAALSIAELVSLMNEATPATEENPGSISLRSVNAVAAHIPYVEQSLDQVRTEMEEMIRTGLESLNQSLLASSLQTAYNLRVLPELVQGLVTELCDTVTIRIRNAFDLSQISKDANAKDSASVSSPTMLYRSRIRTEPTNVTAPQWISALWARLEGMMQDMVKACKEVYTLEKVLKLKRDAATQAVFLDEAMKVLENRPSAIFWTSLARAFEKYAWESAKASTFLQQTLSVGYPRFLRLFHEFFASISAHTDTTYIHTFQSPETILTLRSLANFESLYITRSTGKLNEAVGQAFAGGARTPPGMTEGLNLARTLANELDSARFDPLLVKSVARNVLSTLDMVLTRVDNLVTKDRSAVTLVGPTATPQQATNGSLATFLYHLRLRLNALKAEHTDGTFGVIRPGVDRLQDAFENIVNPLVSSVRRELGSIIAKIHRFDFGRSSDPMAGMGGASLYMKDLVERLSFIKMEILSKFSVGDEQKTWIVALIKFVLTTFVLHVSIVKPLGETGKLQLTSDMTELEFGLSAFLVERTQDKRGGNLEALGADYKTLRAMRPLLFLENSQLVLPQYTMGLPPLIVLHHILVRSPIPLPHSLHGWQESEYVRWVEEHTEEEAWTLVDGVLSHWEKLPSGEDGQEYLQLARQVLAAAYAGTRSES
ncbi:hypothetical protein CYLTODRAFT_492125 [Cylindrobasidium torrendii FP15055 ss-10]|uniref:Conserved oligomeric Golgi complex subunit 5 n=1 Tax=Cylindrobasidium torrendii FP15055 ss-10 TaxID=1314674 RepID=A0A0D7B562_9AGAR|nr:hypothetical protein CYLTODRAFT_492125 [Cylindrobasidium torrendii FP15055 ss-10]